MTCVVSYLDTDGIRHTVEVQAESMYEAAVLAICAFREHDCEPRGLGRLEIEVRRPVTHSVTVKRVEDWLAGSPKSPKDAVLKYRLREMLGGGALQ
jgi:hypothetical protein